MFEWAGVGFGKQEPTSQKQIRLRRGKGVEGFMGLGAQRSLVGRVALFLFLLLSPSGELQLELK